MSRGIALFAWPDQFYPSAATTTNVTMSAGSHAIMAGGQLLIEGFTGSKTLEKLHFKTSSIVSAGGSRVKAAVQDFDASTGGPARPDGTDDSSYTFTAALSANAVNSTGTMSGSFGMNAGGLYTIKFTFDTYGGADSAQLQGASNSGGISPSNAATYNGTAWSANTASLPILLEFTDGTVGQLGVNRFFSAYNLHAFKQDTAGADEYAFKIIPDDSMYLCGARINLSVGSSDVADFDVVFYDKDGSEAEALSWEAGYRNQGNNNNWDFFFTAEHLLEAGETYYVSVRPRQTTANVTVYSCDMDAGLSGDAEMGVYAGSQLHIATRVDLGSWTPNTTRRLLGHLFMSRFPAAGGSTNRPSADRILAGF